MSSSHPAILFMSGASGVGKTTLAQQIYERSLQDRLVWLHPDGFGVPSVAKMIQEAGSLERYQEKSTYRWVEYSLTHYPHKSVVLIDSQSNLQFIQDALKHYQVQRSKVILMHCSQDQREQRLSQDRQQPELASDEMQKWADFLYQQALRLGVPILDTSATSFQESIAYVEAEISKLALCKSVRKLSIPYLLQ
jgi:adenylate kinase family enzyme